MSYQAYTTYTTKVTPQSEPIPGSNQVPNSAGGHSFEVDIWTRLRTLDSPIFLAIKDGV